MKKSLLIMFALASLGAKSQETIDLKLDGAGRSIVAGGCGFIIGSGILVSSEFVNPKYTKSVRAGGYIMYGLSSLFFVEAGLSLQMKKQKKITARKNQYGIGLCYNF